MILHWPQIVEGTFVALSLGINVAKHGESSGKHSFPISLVTAALTIWILHEGGFW